MDLGIFMLSEVREAEISYDIPYMWNLKRNHTNEITYKTGTDSQTYRMNLLLLGASGGQGRDKLGVGVSIYILTARLVT